MLLTPEALPRQTLKWTPSVGYTNVSMMLYNPDLEYPIGDSLWMDVFEYPNQ